MILRGVRAFFCWVLIVGIFLLSISACDTTNNAKWPDNLLQNPDAEELFDHWTTYDVSVWIDNDQGDSQCFSIGHGARLAQQVPVNREDGEYALLIGCVAAGYVHPDGSITDLPAIYGYMQDSENHIDEYLQGQYMFGNDFVQNEWTTAWGIFEIPDTTTSIKFFMEQSLTAGDSYTGALAYFDDLGVYQFETEERALQYVDRYQNRCGTASMVEIVPGDTITILPDGTTTTINRQGQKRIYIKINLGDNRSVTNPPVVMYWSDDLNVEGIESSTAISESGHQYYFDLPSSYALDICESMKYRWIVNYENTLLSKSGIKFDEERFVMPDTIINGSSISQALCEQP